MKKQILFFVLLALSISAFAQEPVKGPFLTNGFGDNWYFSAGFGGNLYVGEGDSDLGMGKRLAPAIDLTLGKWLTPSMGLRIQYAGLTAKGKGSLNDLFADNNGDEKFNVMNLHADYMLNIQNAFFGYRTDRAWELIPYLGFGWARASKSDISTKSNELAANAGLVNKFRISNAVDFNIELRAMLVNQRFDGVEGGSRGEGMGSATIGISYKFGKRDFDLQEKKIVPDYTPYTAKIADLEKQISDEKAEKGKLVNELNSERSKDPVQITKIEYLAYPMSIYFVVGSSKVPHEDLFNLNNYAEVIKKSGKLFKIIGSPDRLTGNSGANKKLSSERANAVYEALVYKFGVNPKQLEIVEKLDANKNIEGALIGRVLIFD